MAFKSFYKSWIKLVRVFCSVILNQLHANSTSQTTPPTTWQSLVLHLHWIIMFGLIYCLWIWFKFINNRQAWEMVGQGVFNGVKGSIPDDSVSGHHQDLSHTDTNSCITKTLIPTRIGGCGREKLSILQAKWPPSTWTQRNYEELPAKLWVAPKAVEGQLLTSIVLIFTSPKFNLFTFNSCFCNSSAQCSTVLGCLVTFNIIQNRGKEVVIKAL